MSLIFIAAVLIGLIVAVVVGRVMLRWQESHDAQARTNDHFKAAAAALEQYVAASTRLPCPADPSQPAGSATDGVEAYTLSAGVYTCSFPSGTLPWATIGMRRDDAFDGWGWKIDYRVYTGNNGSLVQPGGATMVLCNTNSTPSSQTAPTSSGQCQTTKVTAPGDYSTTNTYLYGKGLAVSDYGVSHPDAAYILISHGPSGYGAYTTSGSQLPMPNGDELANTRATGTFQAHAWSDPTVGVNSAQHFDDVLLYRSVADLMKNANLVARAWSIDLRLNQSTIANALGGSASYGNLGQSSINFGPAALTGDTGVTGTPTPTNLTLVNAGGTDGVGVASTSFNPFTFAWQSNYLTSGGSFTGYTNQFIHIAFPRVLQQFAVTLADFGYDSCTSTLQSFGACSSGSKFHEQVKFTFRRVGVSVASVIDSGCKADGGLASFSMTVPADFDSVDITPLTSAEATWAPSFFVVSEVAACPTGASCTTTLAAGPPSNACTANPVSQISTSVTTASKSFSPTSGPAGSTDPITVTMTYSNVGSVAASNVTLTDAIPTGLNYVAGSGSWSGAANAALSDAADGWEVNAAGIDYSYDSATGTVSAIIQSVPANASGSVVFHVTVPSGTSAGPIDNTVKFGSSGPIDSATNFGSSSQAAQATNAVTYTVTQ